MTVTEFRSEREGLLNVREERRCAGTLELREDKKTGSITLEGYAATFDPYDVHGGPSAGGWVEQLSKDSLDVTLASQPDVQLLINHSDMPLARTIAGNLKLSRDGHGLRVRAFLDPTDPDVQRLVPKLRPQPGTNRANMDEMSFAFRVTNQDWDTSYTHRTIRELSLEKGDVSVVNYGMNPGTKAVLSVETLAQMSTKDLVEARSKLDGAQLRRAAAALATIAAPNGGLSLGSINVPVVEPRKDGDKSDGKGDKPYGDVPYADPGYKTDGKKRYPLDTEGHVRAAWSYINMPKNQNGYSSGQVSSIKSRIKAAASKLGIEISSEEKSAAGLPHAEQVARAALELVSKLGLLPPQRALPAARGNGSAGEAAWAPGDAPGLVESQDPHEEPFDMGLVGDMPSMAPVPPNIVGSSGKFVGNHPTFATPPPATDPHDINIDEEMLAMDAIDSYGGSKLTPAHAALGTPLSGGDPHNTPYDLGSPAGGAPQGAVADNIVLTGGELGVGSGRDPGAIANTVGTAPVVEGAGEHYDWTHDMGSEPPAEDLNCDPNRPGIGMRSDTDAYNPETGEGRADCDDDEEKDDDESMALKLDLGLAEALDKTIVHAFKLAEGNQDVRKMLAIARRQLNSIRNIAPAANTDISRKLSELRKEVGTSDASTVTEGLNYLRSAGTAPVGYRGLLDHDPALHVTTPSERLAREAKDKLLRAREASKDSEVAEARLKAARREAELNDVIRRHRKVI